VRILLALWDEYRAAVEAAEEIMPVNPSCVLDDQTAAEYSIDDDEIKIDRRNYGEADYTLRLNAEGAEKLSFFRRIVWQMRKRPLSRSTA
jgi:hypothetical protein